MTVGKPDTSRLATDRGAVCATVPPQLIAIALYPAWRVIVLLIVALLASSSIKPAVMRPSSASVKPRIPAPSLPPRFKEDA